MFEIIKEWLSGHTVETLGAILGMVYIFFSIRQNIFTWPTGILTSVLYVVVFFQSKFYAGMGLQAYYVAISIYGWYFWLKGRPGNAKPEVRVTRAGKRLWLKLVFFALIIYASILFILVNYTDSPIPYMDSLTTALSIVATWMLARKIIEHWLIWVFVDIVSVSLYIYKELWPTTLLFTVYTVMAVIGYFEWKKSLTPAKSE